MYYGNHLTPLLLVDLHLSPNNTVLTVFELTHHLRPFSHSAGFFHWARNPTRPQRSPHSKLSPRCASPSRPRMRERTTCSSPAAPKSSPCSHGHSAACRTCVFGGFWSESNKRRDSEPVCCTPGTAHRQNSWPIHVGSATAKWPPLFSYHTVAWLHG